MSIDASRDSARILKERAKPKKDELCQQGVCTENIPKQLPPLRVPLRKDNEKWVIKSLPPDWS